MSDMHTQTISFEEQTEEVPTQDVDNGFTTPEGELFIGSISIYTGNAEAGVTYNEMLKTAGIESGVYMVRLSSNTNSTQERVVVAK